MHHKVDLQDPFGVVSRRKAVLLFSRYINVCIQFTYKLHPNIYIYISLFSFSERSRQLANCHHDKVETGRQFYYLTSDNLDQQRLRPDCPLRQPYIG